MVTIFIYLLVFTTVVGIQYFRVFRLQYRRKAYRRRIQKKRQREAEDWRPKVFTVEDPHAATRVHKYPVEKKKPNPFAIDPHIPSIISYNLKSDEVNGLPEDASADESGLVGHNNTTRKVSVSSLEISNDSYLPSLDHISEVSEK